MILWTLSLLLAATTLVDAVKQQDHAAVRALLQKGVDVNAATADGATALHWAVYLDDADMTTRLLDAGAKANVANDLAITPLYLASVNGNERIARALLEKGADPNAASETGVTPLMEAARSGDVATVRALLGRRADVNRKEQDRDQTALMWAVARHHADVVRVLLEHGADVHARSRTRPLRVMLDQGPARTVKTSAQDARQLDAGGNTALLFAAQVGDADSAKALIAAGANGGDTGADGHSALVIATFAGHPDVAHLLIEAGADVNAAGGGYSALHAAALRGDMATTRSLLATGANANAPLTKGSPVRRFGSQWALPTPLTGATPLLIAALYLEVGIVRTLLAAGADYTLGLQNNTTPLLAAVGTPVQKEARPSDLVRWNVVDNDSPVIPRDESDVLEVTRALIDAGADVNQSTMSGDTALHAAAGAGLATVIQLLADRGAQIDAKNKAGQTPLALTQPRGRGPEGRLATPGLKAAEELLRKLGASQ